MRIIEIEKLDNGAHRNQDGSFLKIPEGWAIVPDDMDGLACFIEKLEEISEESNVKFTICISADQSELPDSIHKYI